MRARRPRTRPGCRRRLKRRDLESHLRREGCELLREGARHAIWINRERDVGAPVPRHREIPVSTAVTQARLSQLRRHAGR